LYQAPGNAGPPTRARYEYQDACVVLRCIPNLVPDSPVEAVALEWSTDYVLLGCDDRRELVSVKHRDPGQHDWTFARLKDKHVFRDLYGVWRAMGEDGDFFFESNAGFDTTLRLYHGNPGDQREPGQEAVRPLAEHLQADPEQVRRFLRRFFLRRDPLPSRRYINAVAADDLAAVMEQLGLDARRSRTCLTGLAERIAAASTDRPPEPAERVARLTGFIRDLEDKARLTAAGSVLTMEELRGIVVSAAGGTPKARRVYAGLGTGDSMSAGRAREFSAVSDQADAIRRQGLLLEAASGSRGRLAAGWVAVGISADVAQMLADDDAVGSPARLGRELPATGLTVLEGDFGSGKSVTAERIHQEDIAAAVGDDTAPLPVYLRARQVPGRLQDEVRTVVGELGDIRRCGLYLVLDGLDEPGSARAAELLEEARSLVFSLPRSRVIATARPSLALGKDERLPYPPLSDDEAMALAVRLGGGRWVLASEPGAIRDMLRLPLFLIVAVLRSHAGAAVPKSRGTFLDALARAALDRTRESMERSWQSMLSLASLTVSLGGTAPTAELGGEQAVRTILESRLVIREGRAVRFALPVVEQYFAAQTVLQDGLGWLDLHDLQLLDRWRDSLTLAVTIGSWDQVTDLLDAMTRRHPGLATWLVDSAVPSPSGPQDTQLPGHAECARRLQHALTSLVAGLGPAAKCLGFTDSRGSVPAVGAQVDGRSVTAGLRAGQACTDAVRLPEFDPVSRKGVDGSEWRRLRAGRPPADFMAWPWQWGLNWISRDLERLLSARALPLADSVPFQDERRWQLAQAICGVRGVAHRPIDGGILLAAASQLLSSMRARRTVRHTWGNSGVVVYPGEIAAFVEELSEGSSLAGDGRLHRPYPEPDALSPASNTLSSLYSDEALRMLVEQVHANALVIYRNLVATWFPALKPMLGLACIMPVLFTGRVKPGAEIENGPDFVYEMETLLPNERSHAEIRIVATDEELFGYDPSDIQSITARSLRLRRLISALRPGTEGWANPRAAGGDLWVWRNRPATSLAYRWLWEDLKALHLVKQAPPYGED
jgi:hypothetical protein